MFEPLIIFWLETWVLAEVSTHIEIVTYTVLKDLLLWQKENVCVDVFYKLLAVVYSQSQNNVLLCYTV